MVEDTREEELLVGGKVRKVNIPVTALWGAETQLAVENYQITGQHTPESLLHAIIVVKKAAALTHKELGALDPKIAGAIVRACNEILRGRFHRHFPLDVLNSGAGTSLNMNVNEVLANRATQLLNGKIRVDQHNHVNMGQSTNDVMPTAVRISLSGVLPGLTAAGVTLREAFKDKAEEYWMPTTARTHIRDALPIMAGARFLAYADEIDTAIANIARARVSLHELGIGATAVGTGANTVPGYQRLMLRKLSDIVGTEFRAPPHLYGATSSMADFSHINSVLKDLVLVLQPIIQDIILLSSGPNTGLVEIELPSAQPGSSIMPGKVNPSILENLSMVCCVVRGNCASVEEAALLKQFELNARMPVISWKLLESIDMLTRAMKNATQNCIEGIIVHKKRSRLYYENSAAWFTLLNPRIGYEEAAKLRARVMEETANSDETILKALVRVAGELHIALEDGSSITEKALEGLAFPKQI